MRANTRDPQYDGKDFPVVPAGIYTLRIMDVTDERSAKNQYFKWTLEVIGGEYDGSKFWDNTVITQGALWRLVMLLKAAGFDGDFETNNLDSIWHAVKHKTVQALTYVDPCLDYDGKERAKIDRYILPDEQPSEFQEPGESDDIDY